MGPGDLVQILRHLTKFGIGKKINKRLLVGLDTSDDACVFKVSPTKAIVLSVDFFPPIVDEPYAFGAIAAANAMSDVYAMGGEVILALNLVAFPELLPKKILDEILRGGAEKINEGGGIVAGGHTVIDKEPKYGLCVLGFVHPLSILTKGGAKLNDFLILTKPLGTGVITTALKAGKARKTHIKFAVESMMTLNRKASLWAKKIDANACTDVTGFGLLGHAYEMAQRSRVKFRIFGDRCNFFPGAIEYAKQGYLPLGTKRNREHFSKKISFSVNIKKEIQDLLFDPETSGGLLLSVSRNKIQSYEEKGWIIGEVVRGEGIEVV